MGGLEAKLAPMNFGHVDELVHRRRGEGLFLEVAAVIILAE